MTTLETAPARRGFSLPAPGLPWTSWALLLAAGLAAFRPLAVTWNDNPDYSFGWWIPLVSLFLFAERWPGRPPRTAVTIRPGLLWLLIPWGLVFLAFRLATEADPDWRPGIWMLIGLYIAMLLGWLRLYGGASWMRYFAFPVCFLLLSLPWFWQVEYPLVQGLMRWNAVLAATSLQWLGIGAHPVGNIIQLQNCQLGVEEACSGILSLQAAVMMGCLLGEIYRLPMRRRLALVLGSMALALVGNYLRTLSLALTAFYSGPAAVTRWHDTAGYSILVFTAIGSWLVSLALASGVTPALEPAKSPPAPDTQPGQTRFAGRLALGVFVTALVAEAGTQFWFSWHEARLTHHPEWHVVYPIAKGQETALSDVSREALRCDNYAVGQWNDAHGANWTAYWLQYDPKPYTRTVLGWHTPDHCLPAVGLTKDRDYPTFFENVNGLAMAVQPKKFVGPDREVYVFWVVYPNSGDRPPDEDTRVSLPLDTKFHRHLDDVKSGYRGVGVETLEAALTGSANYEAARADFLEGLHAMVVPGRVGKGSTAPAAP